jgi:uncharacterized protein (TIGR03067 family)
VENELRGRWVIDEAFQRGARLGLVVGDRLVIEYDRFIWTAFRGEPERIFRKGNTRGRVVVDPSVAPRRVVLIVSEAEGPGGPPSDVNDAEHTIQAIYRLEGNGDRLRLCVGDPDRPGPPSSFATDPATRQLLLVFQREGFDSDSGMPPRRNATGAEPSARTDEIQGESRR